MERMEEYQRMREEEADRPVPAELACLETRVRARAAERPRRRRGPVLAAVCLCLVLGTGMAWGMGGFAALDRLLGENAGQLIPFYQEVGETVRLEDGMVEIQGVTFTSHSCTVVYRLTAPNGEEAAETPPFYWKLIQGEAGPKESPFSSFVEPSRNGQDLGGNLGWEEVLEGEKQGSTYQVFTISVEEDMSQVEDPKLLLYFSRAVDGVPSADDVPGGTLLTIPAEEVLEERVVRVPGDGEIRQVRVSPDGCACRGKSRQPRSAPGGPGDPAALPGRDGLGAGAGACLSERRTARLLCQRGRGRSADPELVPAGSPPGSGGSGGGGGERDPVSRRVGAEMPRRVQESCTRRGVLSFQGGQAPGSLARLEAVLQGDRPVEH